MTCSKCGNDLKGFRSATPSGAITCYECTRKRLHPHAKAVDDFVRVSRKLCAMRSVTVPYHVLIAVNRAGKRCYTNGHVLISESDSFQGSVKSIDLKSGDLVPGKMTYPNVSRVIGKRPKGDRVVRLTEEFFKLLRVFTLKKRCLVVFSHDSIVVREETGYMQLEYGEADTSKIEEPVAFNAAYLAMLKPKRIVFNDDPSKMCALSRCKVPTTHALIMPMSAD